MFKENFIRLCNNKKESPSAVCRAVGITPATFSCWTDTTVPRRATLLRIADYFGISPEELLADTAASGKSPERILDLHALTDEALRHKLRALTPAEKEKVNEYIDFILSKRDKRESEELPDHRLVAFAGDTRTHKNPPKPKIT